MKKACNAVMTVMREL